MKKIPLTWEEIMNCECYQCQRELEVLIAKRNTNLYKGHFYCDKCLAKQKKIKKRTSKKSKIEIIKEAVKNANRRTKATIGIEEYKNSITLYFEYEYYVSACAPTYTKRQKHNKMKGFEIELTIDDTLEEQLVLRTNEFVTGITYTNTFTSEGKLSKKIRNKINVIISSTEVCDVDEFDIILKNKSKSKKEPKFPITENDILITFDNQFCINNIWYEDIEGEMKLKDIDELMLYSSDEYAVDNEWYRNFSFKELKTKIIHTINDEENWSQNVSTKIFRFEYII